VFKNEQLLLIELLADRDGVKDLGHWVNAMAESSYSPCMAMAGCFVFCA